MPEWIGDNLDKAGFADRMMDGNIAVGGRMRAVTDRMIMATKGKDGASVRQLRAVQREFLRGIEAAAKARSKAKAEEEGVMPREYNVGTSSVKEQLKNNSALLDAMDIVGSVRDVKSFNRKQDATEWVLKQIEKTGYVVNKKGFGEIVFDKKRISKGMNYLKTDEEKTAFVLVPQVLMKGIEIGRHKNHKGRAYDTITFAAPVEISGKRGNMAVVVRQEGKNYYKVHRLIMPNGTQFVFEQKEEDIAETAGEVNKDLSLSPTDNAFNASISASSENVNRKFSNSENSDKTEYSIPAKDGGREGITREAAQREIGNMIDTDDDIAPQSSNRQVNGISQSTAQRMAAAKARSKAKAQSMRGGIVMNEEDVDPEAQRRAIEAAEEESAMPREYKIKYPQYTESDFENNSIILQNMKPVAKLSGKEFEDDGTKTLKEKVMDYYNEIGNSVYNEELGDVALSRTSVSSDVRHGTTSLKTMTYMSVPKVIENGVVIGTFKKNENVDRIVIAAPVLIENEKYYVGAMVQRDYQNQRLYLHDVVSEKESSNKDAEHRDTKRARENERTLFTTSVLIKALNVNRKFSFSENSDETEYSIPAKAGGARGSRGRRHSGRSAT